MALAACAAASCMKEPASTDGGDNGSGQPVEARFSLATAPMNQIEVRATPDLSGYEAFENKIATLIVAQYVDSVAVYVAIFKDMSKVNVRDIPVTLQESPSHVYFLVNTIERDDMSLSVAVGDPESELMTDEVAFSADFADIGRGYPQNVDPMPMIGVWRGTPRGGAIPVPVKVYRSMAKMTLTLSADLPAGDKFDLKQAYVACPYYNHTNYCEPLWRDPEKLDGEGVAPYGGIGRVSNSYRDRYMINQYGELVGNPVTAITYMGEAYYGYGNKGTAKYQKDKTPETGPRIPGVAAEDTGYTHLCILGNYTDGQTGISRPLVYRIYLGGNNTDDYNILRNHHYKVSVTLMGKSQTDVRIEWNGNVGTIDDYTVIRYAQQSRIQQMQTAKVSSSPLKWGQIYPGYDLSTGKGTGTGADGSIAKANWKMSSIEDLMILYAYFRLNTDSWSWLINSGDDTQAYVLGTNGLINSCDTTESHNFYATWVNTLDATVEKKYPYLSADRPVIVSMENDGTGIKAFGKGIVERRDSLYLEDPVSKAFLMDQTAQPVYNEAGGYIRNPSSTVYATNNRVPGKLMVAKADAVTDRKTFAEAYDACKAYSEPDYPAGSWRLPTQRELILIWAFFDELSAQSGFTAFQTSQGYWSGAEDSSNSNYAWFGIVHNGSPVEKITSIDSKTGQNRVRCVRSMNQVYPYVDENNRIIVSDPDGGLPASSLLSDEQKAWLNTHDVTSGAAADRYFEDSEYNKISPNVRVAASNCNPTNAPGVDATVRGTSYIYKTSDFQKACKAYREAPDGSDAGTWRMPTKAEIVAEGFYSRVKAEIGTARYGVPSGTAHKEYFNPSMPPDAIPYWGYDPSGNLNVGSSMPVVRCVRDE